MNILKRAWLWFAIVSAGWTLYGQSEPLMGFAFNITFAMEFWRQFWFEAWDGLASQFALSIGESLSTTLTFLLFYFWVLVPFLPRKDVTDHGGKTGPHGSRTDGSAEPGGLWYKLSIPAGLLFVWTVFAIRPVAEILDAVDTIQNVIGLLLVGGFSLLLGWGLTDGRYDEAAILNRLRNLGFWVGLFVFMNIVGDWAPLVRQYLTDLLF